MRTLVFCEIIACFISLLPMILMNIYLIYSFSTGSFVYIMALDSLIMTFTSFILSSFLIIHTLCQKSLSSNIAKKTIEDSNLTFEFTEGTCKNKSPINLPNIVIENELDTNRVLSEPCCEGSVFELTNIESKIKVLKTPIKKQFYNSLSLGKNDLHKTVNEDDLNFEGFTIDKFDLKKIHVKFKNTGVKATVFKDFEPTFVVDEDGEIIPVKIDLKDYDICSIDCFNPKIGEFQHKVFKTRLRLLRNFDDCIIVDENDENCRCFDEEEAESTIKAELYTGKPAFDCEISEIKDDTLFSYKSSKYGLSLESSKKILHTGTPPKISCSKIVNPHPGIFESSYEAEDPSQK